MNIVLDTNVLVAGLLTPSGPLRGDYENGFIRGIETEL